MHQALVQHLIKYYPFLAVIFSKILHNTSFLLDLVCPFTDLHSLFFSSCEERHTGMRVSALCAERVVNGPHVQACSHWSSDDLSCEYEAHMEQLNKTTPLVKGDKANSFKTLEEAPGSFANENIKWSQSLFRFIWQSHNYKAIQVLAYIQ